MKITADYVLRVKISSEDAGSIAIAPVHVRELRLAELLEWIVGVTGKNEARVAEILERGTFIKSLSRLRWEPLSARDAVHRLLAAMPDDWPTRAFDPAAVREVVFEAGPKQVLIPGDTARARRYFRRESFLDAWLAASEIPNPAYDRYDYGERADRYKAAVPQSAVAASLRAIEQIPSRALRQALRRTTFSSVTFLLPR